MNKLKLLILIALSFAVSDVMAVDLSGVTSADILLFYNYLTQMLPTISGYLITPLALYYSGQFIVSAVYSMFAR